MAAPIIQAQYQTLQDISGRFAKQSEQTLSMISQLQDHLRALQDGGWIGRGADGFFREMNNEVLPATRRLADALSESQAVTLQIIQVLREAEEEAAQPFKMGSEGQKKEQNVQTQPKDEHSQGDGGIVGQIGGALGPVGHFIEDHRDEVALGVAILAAGIATVATGGLAAAPIIAGAVAAGGITIGINAASPKYPLMDGVIGNTIGGAIIGFGVGSIGSAVSTFGIGKTLTSGLTGSGIDFAGQLGNQIFIHDKTIPEAFRSINYSDVAGGFFKGMIGVGAMGSAFDKAGGILKFGLGKTVGLGAITGMGGDQFAYLLKGKLNPHAAKTYGYLSPTRMAQDAAKGAASSVFAYGVAKGVNQIHPWAFRQGLYDHIHYQRTSAFLMKTPSQVSLGISRFTLYQPGWYEESHLGRILSRLEFGDGTPEIADFSQKFIGL